MVMWVSLIIMGANGSWLILPGDPAWKGQV
jgi:hypothetical protein